MRRRHLPFTAGVILALISGSQPVDAFTNQKSARTTRTSPGNDQHRKRAKQRAAKGNTDVRGSKSGTEVQSPPVADSPGTPVIVSAAPSPTAAQAGVTPLSTSADSRSPSSTIQRNPANPVNPESLVSPENPTVPFDSSKRDRLQAALDAWTRSTDVESMTVAITIGSNDWTGATRRDGGAPPDPDATYRVMSITKTVSAALVLRAVEQGRLSLDNPLPPIEGVSAQVPSGITVRRLLGHRSGLTDYTEALGYRADLPMTPEMAADLSLRAPLVSAPGTATRYVNSNYLLLGLLLQQVYGRGYADLVRSLVAPLGLTHTRVDPPDRPGWAGFSSGGIMSTTSDMAHWGDALFDPGRVVSAESLTLMATTGDLGGGLGLWGVCPCSDNLPGVDRFTAIGHFTAAGGMFRFPQSGLTLVMKAEPAGGDTIARAVSLSKLLLAELA